MQDFKNLTVWQASRRLTRSVYELTSDFPQTEEFGLKAQMRRASVSICATIAEGSGGEATGVQAVPRYHHGFILRARM